jgi:hypothetical protein
MSPFVKVERSVATSMEHRLALLQQPTEFFRPFFGGRMPTLAEKAIYIEQMVQRMTSVHLYTNDAYYVEVRAKPPFVHLDIRRHDGGDCKNWRELQQIKNEIVGPEHEAVELFPAESRLVDTANQYHLWVHVSSHFRFPFGFAERCVLSAPVTYQRFTVTDHTASALEPGMAEQTA